jgi:small neutral amino acid transporter SnatA (MarC family)
MLIILIGLMILAGVLVVACLWIAERIERRIDRLYEEDFERINKDRRR